MPPSLTRRETIRSLGVGVATAAVPSQSTASSPPDTVWSRTYDPADGRGRLVSDVAETPHGFVLAGITPTEPGSATWIAGVDTRGNVRWERRLGQPTSVVRTVVAGDENRAFLAGVTNATPAVTDDDHPDPWLVAVSDDGDGGTVEWARTYQPDAPGGEATTATATSDGIVLAGVRNSDGTGQPWVASVDRAGTLQWDWHRDEPDGSGHAAAVTTVAGDVVVGGSVQPAASDGERAWVARLSGSGQSVWRRTPDAEPESRIESFAPAGGDGVVALGNRSFGSDDDGTGWLLALDDAGARQWSRTYSSPAWGWLNVIEPADEGYYLFGSRDRTSDNRRGAWLLRIGSDGRTQWERLAAERYTRGFALLPLADGGVLLAGERERDDRDHGWLAQVGGAAPEAGADGDALPPVPSVPGWATALVVGLGVGAGLERLRGRD
jgi:hypothetical protein